jgi:hypothetical protein
VKPGTLVISFVPGEKPPEDAVPVHEHAWLLPDESEPLGRGKRKAEGEKKGKRT